MFELKTGYFLIEKHANEIKRLVIMIIFYRNIFS